MVIVDTPVWSEFFRRTSPLQMVAEELRKLITAGDGLLVGAVRQEILSGIRDAQPHERLRDALRAFPDVAVLADDYENAASMFNRCRACGIQGSNTDFLLCAVSYRLAAPIFTLDRDFELFAQNLPIRLHVF